MEDDLELILMLGLKVCAPSHSLCGVLCKFIFVTGVCGYEDTSAGRSWLVVFLHQMSDNGRMNGGERGIRLSPVEGSSDQYFHCCMASLARP